MKKIMFFVFCFALSSILHGAAPSNDLAPILLEDAVPAPDNDLRAALNLRAAFALHALAAPHNDHLFPYLHNDIRAALARHDPYNALIALADAYQLNNEPIIPRWLFEPAP